MQSSWPVCGKCCEIAWFPWMGGPHHCVVAEPEDSLDDSPLNVGGRSTVIIEWPEDVRECPSIYLPTDQQGLQSLIWTVVDRAVDETSAGHAATVDVTLLEDGGAQVSDEGRGIEVLMHVSTAPTVVVVTASSEAGSPGPATGIQYGHIDGARAQQISMVNALCIRLEVENRRDGYRWFQNYERGLPQTLERGQRTDATGTTARFWPDPTIFANTTVDGTMLAQRLQELAYLNPGLTSRLIDERLTDDDVVDHFYPNAASYTAAQFKVRTFHYPDGLLDYVRRINRTRTPIHPSIIHFSEKCPGLEVEIAMQWNAGYSESVHTFANTRGTHEGGTHEEGFRSALTGVVNKYAKDRKLMRSTEPDLAGDDIREGLAAVVSVTIAEPLFEGQTETKLANADVKPFVQVACEGNLTRWFGANPTEANVIVRKTISSGDARRMPRRSRCR